MDRFASLCSKFIFCAKGACDAVAPVGISFGIMGGIDGIREAKGLQPIFFPFLADVFIKDTPEAQLYKEKRAMYKRLSVLDHKYAAIIQDQEMLKTF